MTGFLAWLRSHPLRLAFPLTFLVFLSFGSVRWWRSGSVLLTADGHTRRIFPKHTGTLREFLNEQRITLGAEDVVAPALSTLLTRNLAVKITRVRERKVAASVSTAPVVRWSQRTRVNLRRVLVEKGYSIEHLQTYRVITHDGEEMSRRLLSQKDVRHPFFTLTLFNSAGFPKKKYDLLKAKTLKMLATGYYVGDPMVPGDETRLGYRLQRGLVAVDPKVISLGTRLFIPGYGYAFASDTGSAIQGKRIDLAVDNAREERQYNHRKVTVFLLDKGRKW